MTKLDRCEGVRDGHYRRRDVDVVTDDGEVLRAVAYIADDEERLSDELSPTMDYLDMVLQGAREHGLPEDYIRFVEGLGGLPAWPVRALPAGPSRRCLPEGAGANQRRALQI
jgi:hypothetical protein